MLFLKQFSFICYWAFLWHLIKCNSQKLDMNTLSIASLHCCKIAFSLHLWYEQACASQNLINFAVLSFTKFVFQPLFVVLEKFRCILKAQFVKINFKNFPHHRVTIRFIILILNTLYWAQSSFVLYSIQNTILYIKNTIQYYTIQ